MTSPTEYESLNATATAAGLAGIEQRPKTLGIGMEMARSSASGGVRWRP